MTISTVQTVDYLNKKLVYGLAKTDLSAAKGPSNETIPSPLLVPGATIWQVDTSISSVSVLPSANTSVVSVYRDSLSSAVQCVRDNTASGTNQTWLTNLIDWIPTSFGAGYQIKLYAAPVGYAGNISTSGVSLPQAGTGNNDSWTFDYQAGVINFADTNVPTAVTWNGTTGNVVYAVGARYTGQKGITNFVNGLTLGNITIGGSNISSNGSNVTVVGNLVVTGNLIGSVSGNINSTDILGTVNTANVSLYNAVTPTTANGTYYPELADKQSGNSATYTTSTFSVNPSTGNVQAISFVGNLFGTVKTNAQPYITSIGTLNSLDVLGNISASNLIATQFNGNVIGNTYGTHTGNVNGTILTSSQPYITSVGTLNALTVNGNVTAGNVSAEWYTGNIKSDLITTNTGNIVIDPGLSGLVFFQSNAAILLPKGTTPDRPDGVPGQLRYNTDLSSVEYFNGSVWVPVTNEVTDQQIVGNGVSDTFTLSRISSAIAILVSINGTLQQPNNAYTVAGDQITFSEVPLSTDVIDIRFIASTVAASVNATIVDTLATTIGTTASVIDSVDLTLYRGAKYTITSSNSYDSHMAEVHLLHHNGSASVLTYGNLNTGSNTVTYTANISSGMVNLMAQGTAPSNQLRLQKTYFLI